MFRLGEYSKPVPAPIAIEGGIFLMFLIIAQKYPLASNRLLLQNSLEEYYAEKLGMCDSDRAGGGVVSIGDP